MLPTSIFRPGEFHGLYSPWGRKKSDTTEQLIELNWFNNKVRTIDLFLGIRINLVLYLTPFTKINSHYIEALYYEKGFPDSSVGKESACNIGDTGSIPGLGRSPGEGIGYRLQFSWASLVAQLVKNLSAMWDTWV